MKSHLKVYAYITLPGRLLVFRHTHFPEAGIQVPGGTVETGEMLESAVLREAQEETGLQDLRIAEYLGEQELDARPWGKDELHLRHFYHLEPGPETFPGGIVPERWLHVEMTPSDGGPAIEFEFYWAWRDPEPPHHYQVDLIGELGVKLSLLN